MPAQLFLLTPPSAEPSQFPTLLGKILSSTEIAALLVLRHGRTDADYTSLIRAILPVAQAAFCAVLVQDDPALAKSLGADGVHVGADLKAAKAAIAALKPTMIVGAGPFATRHDAMSIGELDVDYVLFGPLDGAADAEAGAMAAWWAETFEVPAVLSDPDVTAATADAFGSEFLAVSTSLWTSDSPATSIAMIAEALEAQ